MKNAVIAILIVIIFLIANDYINNPKTIILKKDNIDSLVNVQLIKKDSLYTLEISEKDKEIKRLKSEKLKIEKNYKKSLDEYKKDTFVLDIRDTVIFECSKLVEYQDSIILNQDSSIKTRDSIIVVDSLIILLKNKKIENLQINQSILENKTKRTWFEKNGKWVGLGLGFFIGVLIK
jgi:hypothetical protein